MAEPSKCPRCGTEGCPTKAPDILAKDSTSLVEERRMQIEGDIACSLRALVEQAKKPKPAIFKQVFGD